MPAMSSLRRVVYDWSTRKHSCATHQFGMENRTKCVFTSQNYVEDSISRYRQGKHRFCPAIGAEPDRNQSLSELEIEVPVDQRPVNELNQLKSSLLYSWVRVE